MPVPPPRRTTSHWRLKSREVIGRAMQEYVGPMSAADIKEYLSPFYPFGERKYTPYKIWLQEVNHYLSQIGAAPKWDPRPECDHWPLRHECKTCLGFARQSKRKK
jgi:hypothetical protein